MIFRKISIATAAQDFFVEEINVFFLHTSSWRSRYMNRCRVHGRKRDTLYSEHLFNILHFHGKGFSLVSDILSLLVSLSASLEYTGSSITRLQRSPHLLSTISRDTLWPPSSGPVANSSSWGFGKTLSGAVAAATAIRYLVCMHLVYLGSCLRNFFVDSHTFDLHI